MKKVPYLISSLFPLLTTVLIVVSIALVGGAGHRTASGFDVLLSFTYSMINLFINIHCVGSDKIYRNKLIRIFRVGLSAVIASFLIYELVLMLIDEPLMGFEYLIPLFLVAYIINELYILYDNK